jgi:hypothetical protein
LERRGYSGVLKHLESNSCGAACWGSFLVTVWRDQRIKCDFPTTLEPFGNDGLPVRGFSNCLLPVNVPRECWKRHSDGPTRPSGTDAIRENQVGWVGQHPLMNTDGPILLNPLVWIQTPKGIRRLAPQEWLKIKGLPTTWEMSTSLLRDIVEMPGVPEWNAVGDHFLRLTHGSKGSNHEVTSRLAHATSHRHGVSEPDEGAAGMALVPA